ncbi:MAG TPA: HlyD family efflux transporter periplasmic adaptor subunit [Noviherbaspirillum sp.]|uniref:HlyD family secretion protein n=1 Tax=Noviherbaspirillum sp. TaxID=1926288 RepID=UPI002B466806|nr:HlyD family efflux transporter periplasmic adaptor subunit [Noviherbaspirillum sp.]HJV87773.1 HlyD family efflux transporter periplasmic adaptor subunit [Noviherbaspirillum sp.]
MVIKWRTWLVRGGVVLAAGALILGAWQRFGPRGTNDELASGNGRIEAVEIDVSSRVAGRVKEIRVAEGEFVTAGQLLAVIETEVLDAQRRQAEAQRLQAENAVATARSQLAQRKSDRAAALAVVAQRNAELKAANTQLSRSEALSKQGFISPQVVDNDRTRLESAQAAISAARAQVVAAQAAIVSAQSQVAGAQSSAAAAQANVERIQADIDDAQLKAPRDGRIQYLVVQPGEIVAAGGRVINLLDLSDVYMTFFLPTAAAGRVALGTDVRLVLDAAPQYVIPARVSFVASEAQFTPKTVETASEREKLMFRVKAQLPPELLRKHMVQVKTGLPGTAYVRLDATREWPTRLQLKTPP